MGVVQVMRWTDTKLNSIKYVDLVLFLTSYDFTGQFRARLHLLHKNIKQCKKEVKSLTTLTGQVNYIQ